MSIRYVGLFLAGCCAALPAAAGSLVVVTRLDDGAGTCPSPTDCTLREAIDSALAGDTIVFDPALSFPADLPLTAGELLVAKNLTIQGPGTRTTVLGGNLGRVLRVDSGTLTVRDLSFGQGLAQGNNGINGTPGTGGAGQGGFGGEGGCVRVAASAHLILERVSVRGCTARGGNGGIGGSGANATNNALNGGSGGSGGSANGGAIWAAGQLTLRESSVSNSFVIGGNGGFGGFGGNATSSGAGAGGSGGNGGFTRGALIYMAGPGALSMRNSTLATGVSDAGNGGNGGNGGSAGGGGTGNGGDAGDGGTARGGGLHLAAGVSAASIAFSTLGPSTIAAGPGGNGGAGTPNGAPGDSGLVGSEILFAGIAPSLVSSLVAGAVPGAADCEGLVTAVGRNRDSDGSCIGFSSNIDYATGFQQPGPQFIDGRVVLALATGSPAIDDALDCADLVAAPVTIDQNGTARPQDGNESDSDECDLGAVEFVFGVFADGFED